MKKIKSDKVNKELFLRKALGTDCLQTYNDGDHKCLQRKEKIQNFTIYFVNLTSLD